MINVTTETEEEYQKMLSLKKSLEKEKVNITVNAPTDSYASTCWSIDDVREYFPEGTTDDTLVTFMEKNERGFKDTYIGAANEILAGMAADAQRVAF